MCNLILIIKIIKKVMNDQNTINFNRIAEAIGYITDNYKDQPSLDEIAEKVHLSPFHFQKMFSDWAGISPKKFLQYISLSHAKQILRSEQDSIAITSYKTGLSGSSRLHDLFMSIEGMTPAEFKNGGKNLEINYSLANSPFGNIIIASTKKGICHLAFYENEDEAKNILFQKFPNATYHHMLDLHQQNALFIFSHDWSKLDEIKLHLKGTEFQLKVWECLMNIPSGHLTTYGDIAEKIDKPKASRAVGTAIGSNPVAYLIPCHRVIQSSGHFGQYHWGSNRKTAIIGWEAAKTAV